MSFEKHVEDNSERRDMLMGVYVDTIGRSIIGSSDWDGEIRRELEGMKKMASTMDLWYSSNLEGQESTDYAIRIKSCLESFDIIERRLRGDRTVSLSHVIGSLGYLKGELNCLEKTFELNNGEDE
jgi:hypothetical protein